MLVPMLGGCMSVYIIDAAGAVRVERGLGLLRVDAGDPKRTVIGSIDGIGLLADPLGWSVGYTRQRWALLGDDCRAVVWPGPGGLDPQARDALARAAAVCTVSDDAGHLRASASASSPGS